MNVPTPTPPTLDSRRESDAATVAGDGAVVVDPTVSQSWRAPSGVGRVPTPNPEDSAEPLRGDLFREKYLVEGEIGRGGMGRVLVAYDRDLKRRVAMKVMDTTASNVEILRRFIEEAQISGQLEHPNLLPVHDVGITDKGEFFFTMKLVRSHSTLRGLIDGLAAGDAELHAHYTFERRVSLVQSLCRALDYAHARGVVHRDVKPENIMLGEQGEVYLLDWGIARLRHELEERAQQISSPPKPGAATRYLVGTPAYMAPEQSEGEPPDQRADVYSLVAVLFELLTLHHYLADAVVVRTPAPSPGAKTVPKSKEIERSPVMKVVEAVRKHVPKDAESYYDSLNGRAPRILSRICRRGLLKDRAERFQTARELEEELTRWQSGCGPVVCPGTALQRGMSGYSRVIDRHPLLVPLVTYLMLGLGLLTFGYLAGQYLTA